MEVKFTTTTTQNLAAGQVLKIPGQIIALSDAVGYFYDMYKDNIDTGNIEDVVRYPATGHLEVATLPEPADALLGVIYIIKEGSDSGVYVRQDVEVSGSVVSSMICISSLRLDSIVSPCAPAHNAIYRGEDLTNKYTVDEICSRISAGTFDDLYIGDYFDITFTNPSGTSEQMRCILAGFDYYYNQQKYGCTQHHAVIVPKNCVEGLFAINTTYTTNPCEGGFVNSTMFTTTLPSYLTPLQNALNNHILTYKNQLSSDINATGASNAGAGLVGYASAQVWTDITLNLLSEIQVYGTQIYSSSFYNNGLDTTQLPLFRHDLMAKLAGKGGVADLGNDATASCYWLRDVVSKQLYARVNDRTSAYYHHASQADHDGLRPCFLIG